MENSDTPAPGRDPLPRHTTPTWEMELLVSGATVFGLMQLPALADRVLFGVYNAAVPEVAMLAPSIWLYVKFTLLTLIGTFLLHLCLRGYWVALTGLNSVYPEGIRWDRLRGRNRGPVFLEVARETTGTMAEVVERADNRASRVFGVGFGLAMIMLMPMLLVSGVMVAVWTYRALGGDAINPLLVLSGVMLVAMLPFGALMIWDRRQGAELTADTRGGLWMRRLFRIYAASGFSRASNPLMTLYSSNEGAGRTVALIAVSMVAVLTIVLLQSLSARFGWDVGDYRGLPEDVITTPDLLLPRHYASQRGDAVELGPGPFIPDPVVRGAYLRVFVPYVPVRMDPAMEAACPEALADTGDTGPRARLDCLGKLNALAIDGVPVDLRYDAGEDPATGQRGLVAMIPARDLAPGRHELTVQRPASHPKEPWEMREPYRIPFWR